MAHIIYHINPDSDFAEEAFDAIDNVLDDNSVTDSGALTPDEVNMLRIALEERMASLHERGAADAATNYERLLNKLAL